MPTPNEIGKKVADTAAALLQTADKVMMPWPAEFRAIMWGAIARAALDRAMIAQAEADKQKADRENPAPP